MAVAEMILNYTIAQGVTRTAFGRFPPIASLKITRSIWLLTGKNRNLDSSYGV